MQNSRPVSSPALFYLLTTLALLVSVVLAIGFGWLAVSEPGMARQATALLVIGFNGVLVFVAPLAGFLVWLVVSLFAPFLPFDIAMPAGVPDLSFTRVVAGLMVLSLLAQVARGKRRLPPLTAIDAAIPIFALMLLAAAVRSRNGVVWATQSVLDSYFVPLLAYFFARQLVQDKRAYRALANTLLFVGAIIAVSALVEQLTGFSPFRTASTSLVYAADIRKVGALLGNPAYIAVTVAIVLPLAIVRLFEDGSWRRWLDAALVGVFLVGIFLTYNRSGWLAGALALVIMAVSYHPFRRLALPMLVVASVAAFLAWGNLQDTAAAERFTAQSPVDYRLAALQAGIDVFQQQPLVGIGWGNFGRTAASSGFSLGANVHVLPSTHNTYLNFLVAGGVLLLGTYLLLLGAVIAVLWRLSAGFRRLGAIPPYVLAAWAALAAYAAPAIAFDNNFAIYTNIVFWSLLGATVGVAIAGLAGGDKTPAVSAEGPARS